MSNPSSIRLSELTSRVQQVISTSFGAVKYWVIADVTNYTYKAERNFHYFDLVEKDTQSAGIIARFAARAWGNAAMNITNFERATGQLFKNDLHVLIQVEVLFNAVYGLQLNVVDIDTSFTLGHLEQQRKATLERLLRENPAFISLTGGVYQTRNSQLTLAPVIQRIAVISSETSAGYQDFKHTLENNAFGYKIIIDNYFALVQGEANAKAFLARLITVFESGIPYDAIVLIRGGGAQTDFLLFDQYELSRAIAKFPIPVITGIGHQKNETIADLMAHTSTKTPTKAAEFIIAHNRGFEEILKAMQQTLIIKAAQLMAIHKDKLNTLNQQTIHAAKKMLTLEGHGLLSMSQRLLSQPQLILAGKKRDLENVRVNLAGYSKLYLHHQQREIEHIRSLMRLMSPENILSKGFALLKVNGEIIKDVTRIETGTIIEVVLADTEIETKVLTKKYRHGKEYEL